LLKIISQIKFYRKLRYRKGYGVHSPFTYNLITKVIEEKAPYYVFDEIEKFRKEQLSGKKEKRKWIDLEARNKNYGPLLFRLINFFKCRSVLEIGASSGIESLYLSMASPNYCDCHVLYKHEGILDSVRDFVSKHHLENLHFTHLDKESLGKLKNDFSCFDMIFINYDGDGKNMEETLHFLENFIREHSILIIDGIARNKTMKELWKKLINHPKTGVTIDLYALGIVFFDLKLQKKQYKNYFDYGQKQNLHEKRRRRFHFVGWRKKSKKNGSTH
jgi:predicted O-methyltransferase YrrM